MKLYSTNHQSPEVDLREAVTIGLPPDNGLYLPNDLPSMKESEIDALTAMDFDEMAFSVLNHLLAGYIPAGDLQTIVQKAFGFDASLHELEDQFYIQELFHGPTLAFKDFGARFMGRLFEYFLRNSDQKVHILVATSGDTGSAVAHGFLDTKGIEVTILYPKGKVSDIQERQFATLGRNIRVLEVEGTFDDCQRLVKEAFLDKSLNEAINLSSANSINIARLIPQSLYYFRAYGLSGGREPITVSVPSGNFGNLTAGLMAWRMGLPIKHMVASNNANDVFTQYWRSGQFHPKASVQTISNAMDVGDPSNFKRILDLYNNDWEAMKKDISAYTYSDARTLEAIENVYREHEYLMCPHTAVGYLGAKDRARTHGSEGPQIVLATAHPVKFKETVDAVIDGEVTIPDRLKAVLGSEKLSIPMEADYLVFRDFLMENK